jgi:hypothetical protein
MLTLGVTALGYQLPATLEIPMGSELATGLGARGFHDAEGWYRWSRARSSIEFQDPGASASATLEVEMAGFRPPGLPIPIVILETTTGTHRTDPTRRIGTFAFPVETSGLWSSDFEATLRSETFVPGAGDQRSLGVRVHSARLRMPAWALPPLRQLLSAAAVSWFLVALLAPAGERRRAASIAIGAALGFGVAFGFARLYAARAVPPLALALGTVYLVDRLLPAVSRFLLATVKQMMRSLRLGASIYASRTIYLVVGATAIGVCGAYALRSEVEVDFGSPATSPRLVRFESFDRDEGHVFRESLTGASVDLRDIGAGAPWTMSIDLSLRGEQPRTVPVTIGDALMSVAATPEWSRATLETRPPTWGFRSGTVFQFVGERSSGLRISTIRIDRGRSLPSARVLAYVLASVALIAASLAACGLSSRVSSGAALAFAVAFVAALATWPAPASSFAGFAPIMAALALGLAVTLVGVCGAAQRSGWPELEPAAFGLAVVGFCCWSAAVLSPHYVGGHFVYHSNIAEEIWNGRFWHYFFPHPDNMLSHQPQWGNAVVPHPSLYHSLASPFAALPAPWFYLGTKGFLAALLALMSVCAGLVASRAGTASDGARPGTWAVLLVVAAPTGYQLLELGHLMTLFGTTMITAALAFVILEVDRLEQRGTFWLATGLLSVGFLSYTGSLLFGSAALALAAAASYVRRDSFLAKRIVSMLLAAWAGALALYYAYWVVPFVRDSLPALAGGTAAEAGFDWWTRLRALPGKLAYTYGSSALVAVGLFGLGLGDNVRLRRLLVGWGLVLVVFGAVDLRFNLLLKHHYFAFPALGVGFGLAMTRVLGRGGSRRWLAIPVAAALVLSGVERGWRAAWGESSDAGPTPTATRNENS